MDDFDDFLTSVLLDIKDEFRAGNKKTTYQAPKKWAHLVGDVADNLRNRDNPYVVEITGEDERTLEISWEHLDLP